ncbi:MAG TPA: type VI secretion system tube protein Hcp, partial [Gemmatimonadaceae bacterium]|nr:type VI secretion system tube protein Hcp [Gemmatimonadaceae bacterium]
VYKFEEAMVESVQWSGSSGGDDTPTESVSFAFAKVTIDYKPQKPDGKLGTSTPVVWDVRLVSDK